MLQNSGQKFSCPIRFFPLWMQKYCRSVDFRAGQYFCATHSQNDSMNVSYYVDEPAR